MTEKKKSFHYAWIILFALCIVRSLSAAGINNTGGLFLTPVAESFSVGVGTLSIQFSIASIATLLSMPFAGKLLNRYSAKIILIAAAILQAGSFILLGFMNHIAAWFLLSIPMGIGSAILVNLAGPIIVNRWFRKNAGKALGILMACAGLFGVVIQPLVSNLIAKQGWRFTYAVFGAVLFLLIVIVTFFFIRSRPEDKGIQPYGLEEGQGKNGTKTGVTEGVPYKEARKSKTFFGIFIFMIALTAFGAFNQHMATYGQSIAYNPEKIGLLLSISMIGCTVGAVFIGIIADRIGVLKSSLGIILIAITSLICLYFASTSYFIFVLGGFLMGLAGMGIPVLAPLLTIEFFGEKDYELIYSNVMMGPPLASVILLPLYGFIFDAVGNYQLVFLLILVLILIGAVCLKTSEKKQKIGY